MSHRLRNQLLAHLLKITVVESEGLDFFKFVNADFLSTSLSGMKTLFMNSKQNFYLSKCFEGPSPQMPINRMPYGLLREAHKTLALRNIMSRGLQLCSPILVISGYASTGDLPGSTKCRQMMRLKTPC